ncbi:hypothetical protein [Acetivibrio mesophilus]|uniref:Uncharacterized protein n=1 Tax=Acetivibrio mesophilus TaxID=2487273 RepID=A0A4Q0I1D5_9FIRM|nr:hypothetical protein [Acetivibrio mesophilus]RXE57901.1 hypothetical protein EFD62_15110 [Acetivibrio mesophilus]HHV29975.1 hypothetical protein [Clostridium sp.]
MASGDLFKDYPYILRTLRELNCELNQIKKSKELMEDTLQYFAKSEKDESSLDPTLQAVEKVLHRYENNISYITERINELKEMKNKIDRAL